MAPPPHPSPVLIEDTTAEILLRVPPEEPADLVRASIASKLWRRILSDRAFGRRYREFHRVPPMLGFFVSNDAAPKHMPRFVPTTWAPALFPPPPFNYNRMCTLDCRHGRVLCRAPPNPDSLLVWDPITGDCQRLPWNEIALDHQRSSAVLCAVGSSCNHHDCHRGPFLVVSVGAGYLDLNGQAYGGVRACVYSSRTGAWGPPIALDTGLGMFAATKTKTSIVIGDQLYLNIAKRNSIVKFDLDKNSLSMIDVPSMYRWFDVLIVTEDRSLGFAGVRGSKLYLWSRRVDPEGLATWIEYRVICIDNPWRTTLAAGFAHGPGVIFLSTEAGTFALDLRSGLKKRIIELVTEFTIFPFVGFYTPDCSTRKLQSPAETN